MSAAVQKKVATSPMNPAVEAKIAEHLGYLRDRWQDEAEYEDFAEYGVAAMQSLPVGAKFLSLTKRPFRLEFEFEGTSFRFTANASQVRIQFKPVRSAAPTASPAELTSADLEVRDPKGRQTRDGIAFSGVLYIRNKPVAMVRNEGCGGCNTYQLHPGTSEAFAEFKALAVKLHPDQQVEQEDTLFGDLWDVAFTHG